MSSLMILWAVLKVGLGFATIPTDPGHLGNYSHLRAWDSVDHQPHTHALGELVARTHIYIF